MTQNTTKPWHEQDEFWETFAPTLFDAQRRSVAGEEIEKIAELIDLQPAQRICDLCCGVGRHSLELARRGHAVTSVDRTQRYLDEAKNAARAEDLQVEFVQADMRKFCRSESFHVVLNLFTSFGYFDAPQDDHRVLENVHRSLKPGGRLVLDLIGKEILARIFIPRDWQEIDGTLLLAERKILDAWTRIECRWILFRDGARREWTFSHGVYSAGELRRLLADVGFADIRVYGNLDGAPYAEKAERLVIVARKSAPGSLDEPGAATL